MIFSIYVAYFHHSVENGDKRAMQAELPKQPIQLAYRCGSVSCDANRPAG
jgi:hypothetical protein